MSLYDLLNNNTDGGTSRAPTIMAGTVTNNDDPKKLGRVKVKLHWGNDEQETDWVPIAVLMAGKERGTYFLPEVNDCVLVALINGDVNSPVVLGSLWTQDQKPPESNAGGKNNVRSIVSRSGHKIVLNDENGSEKIEIIDKTGNNKILFDTTQNTITIESSQSLNIKSGIIKIEADQSLEIKSSGSVKINGTLVQIN